MATFPVKYETPHRGLEFLQWYDKHKVFHPGADLNFGKGNDDFGAPIVAPFNSVVEYVSPKPTKWNRYNKGFGLFVILYHARYGVFSRYAHLDKAFVRKGDKLSEAQHFCNLGNSGTIWAHLHFEIFGQEMFEIQEAKGFKYYPSGKTKAYIMDHYENPLKFIQDLRDHWAAPYEQALIEAKKIKEKKPLEENISRAENYKIIVEQNPALKKIYQRIISKK